MVTLSPSARARTDAHPVGWSRFALVGLGTVVAAPLANALVYYAGRATVGYDPRFVILADVGTPVFFTVVPAIVAVLLYAALLRFARRPAHTFRVVAAVVFVGTLLPTFALIPGSTGATTAQTAILILMHVVAATVITGMLTRLARRGG